MLRKKFIILLIFYKHVTLHTAVIEKQDEAAANHGFILLFSGLKHLTIK